eukprot:87533-Pleurochrysis_carterae.AAC.1
MQRKYPCHAWRENLIPCLRLFQCALRRPTGHDLTDWKQPSCQACRAKVWHDIIASYYGACSMAGRQGHWPFLICQTATLLKFCPFAFKSDETADRCL